MDLGRHPDPAIPAAVPNEGETSVSKPQKVLARWPSRWKRSLSPSSSVSRAVRCHSSGARSGLAATAVGYQLHRAPVEVVNVAACGLGRIGAGNDDVDATGARGCLRQSD